MTASSAEKYPLLLMVSEAANAELDLGGVLASVSRGRPPRLARGRAYVRTPLVVRTRFLGSITFARLSDRRFSPEEVELLEEVTRPVAGALAYHQLVPRLRRRSPAGDSRRNQCQRETFGGSASPDPWTG